MLSLFKRHKQPEIECNCECKAMKTAIKDIACNYNNMIIHFKMMDVTGDNVFVNGMNKFMAHSIDSAYRLTQEATNE